MTRPAATLITLAALAVTGPSAAAENMGTASIVKVEISAGVRMTAHAEFDAGGAAPDPAVLVDQLAIARRAVPAAYRFFVSGKHPYRRYLRWLDRAARPDTDGGERSQVLDLAGVQVELFVVAGTPREIRDKLAFDFVLAQAFNPGFFASIPRYANDTGLAPLDVAYQQSYYAMPLRDLARLVAYTVLHPKAWAALVATRGEAVDPNSQASVERSAGLLRVRALDRALHRRRLGAARIAEAARTWEPTGNLTFLLFVSSELDRDERAALAKAFGDPAVVDAFKALL
jgi:hypothetical protein